ncbi:hypothetical protein [Flaviaesturariibacter aridisoli]|uniref:Uncharacterized protein n=1 Tax=Flaviaesturariibacter aridisoli TaxID=2545761 RepID=A0A4R4E3I4_9BACT|nr:hypothetical protein [Flaviaesturariibacter aridisoli]TCZ74076.1 hypothetical protein E0486_03090 [Flaviaesturariibacter aridisoli]
MKTSYNYEIVWQKYLPVIRIVMKRALTGSQVLKLNANDFERIGLTRKSGYKFDIRICNGKTTEVIIDHPLASSLAQVLLNDSAVGTLISDREFELSLSSRYELTICQTSDETVPRSDDQS